MFSSFSLNKLSLSIVFSLLATPAFAEESTEDMETITVFGTQHSYFEKARNTALKIDADDLETPFTSNVINSAMLEDLKANTLEDAYSYIGGLSRTATNANSFTIRGHTADLQNIQVDGLPGLVSRFGSPVTANIERVEVLKGPASVLYGWMDPGGLVNIITKTPNSKASHSIDITAQHFVDQGESGIEGSIDSTGSINEGGTLNYRLIAGAETEDSFRNFVENETLYLFPSVSWLIDEDTRLDAKLEYTKEKRNADNGLFVANNDITTVAPIETYYQEPGDDDNDEGTALSIKLEHYINADMKAAINWRSVIHKDDRTLYESNAVVQGDAVEETTLRRRNRSQANKRNYHFVDANLSYSFGEDIKHEMLFGVNGGYEYRQFDRTAYDTRGAFISIYNPEYTGDVLEDDPGNFRRWNLHNSGLYVFDKITFNEHWTAIAGLRFDYQRGHYRLKFLDNDTTADEKTTSSSTTFNAGLVYQINDETSLYTSYAQSFNPQSVGSYDINGEQLDAEEGEQFEIGFKVSMLDNNLNINGAYFNVIKSNLSEENDATGFDELIGEISSEGLEVSLQYQPTKTFQFQAGYTYTDAEMSESFDEDILGNDAPFAPKHNAFIFGRYNHPKAIMGGLVGASLGIKHESSKFTDEEVTKRVLLPSYTVVDLGVFYEVDSFKYALNVSNLTNKTYYVGGVNDYRIFAGEPMKLSLSMRYDF